MKSVLPACTEPGYKNVYVHPVEELTKEFEL
jgi:hypothetical protein